MVELIWAGKETAINHTGEKVELELDFELSKNSDVTSNEVYIGDNLDILETIKSKYENKIKMIYIDPPYNTGNQFTYNDKFGTKADTHDNWLNFMYPRLKVAYNLLEDDGVILISVDDNGQANLKKICDEIFGEDNFITQFVWEKTQHFVAVKQNYYDNCEYILCYAKKLYSNKGVKKRLLVERVKDEFEDAPLFNGNVSNTKRVITFPPNSVKFNIPDGEYTETTDDKYNLIEPVTVKDCYNTNELVLEFKSRWIQDTVLSEYENGATYLVKTTNFAVRVIYNSTKESFVSLKKNIFTNSNNPMCAVNRFGRKVGVNKNGTAEIVKYFGKSVFSYPKPTSLLTYFISSLHNTNKDDIILDFFAGSGSTGDAVMQINALDGGSRKFVLIQLPEQIDPKIKKGEVTSDSYKFCINNGFEPVISSITIERLNRAGDKIGLGDTGYKVYKVKGK